MTVLLPFVWASMKPLSNRWLKANPHSFSLITQYYCCSVLTLLSNILSFYSAACFHHTQQLWEQPCVTATRQHAQQFLYCEKIKINQWITVDLTITWIIAIIYSLGLHVHTYSISNLRCKKEKGNPKTQTKQQQKVEFLLINLVMRLEDVPI